MLSDCRLCRKSVIDQGRESDEISGLLAFLGLVPNSSTEGLYQGELSLNHFFRFPTTVINVLSSKDSVARIVV